MSYIMLYYNVIRYAMLGCLAWRPAAWRPRTRDGMGPGCSCSDNNIDNNGSNNSTSDSSNSNHTNKSNNNYISNSSSSSSSSNNAILHISLCARHQAASYNIIMQYDILYYNVMGYNVLL